MKYLIVASEGPGFESKEEAQEVLNELVFPSFEYLIKLEKDKKILAGGLPVGERTLVFIAEAGSNQELAEMLRRIPLWGIMQWEVTPLEPFVERQNLERNMIKEM